MSTFSATFSVWLFILILGLASWPSISLLFGFLSDKGYAVSKALGLVILSYLVLILATLRILPLYYSGLMLLFILWAMFNTFLLFRYSSFKSVNLKSVLVDEILFTALFLSWTFLKARRPEIYQIERFMDFGFIQTLLNSNYLPLEDVWMSGVPLNYYYFGHLVSFVVIRLSGIPTEVGFYLAGSTLFALLGVNVFRLTSDLVSSTTSTISKLGKYIAGLISLYFVLFAGDLGTALKLITNQPFYYPEPTRVIPGTITEMPIYSFLVADLHAHVWGLLIGMLVLTYLFILWNKKTIVLRNIFPLGFLIGISVVTNTWDAATLGILTSIVLFFAVKSQEQSIQSTIFKLSLYLTAIILLALITASPWLAFFKSPVNQLGLVTEHSPIKLWLSFWGQFVIISVLYLAFVFKNIRTEWNKYGFLLLITISSYLFLLLIDLFYVKDVLKDGVWYRANTVFKVTGQVWLWLGITAGPVFVWLFSNAKKYYFKVILVIVFTGLIAAAAFYPVNSIKQALLEGRRFMGLDSGLNWWKEKYPDDFRAYLFLRNIRDSLPEGDRKRVILEAEGESYTDTSRFSTFLGWPTVAGWSVHEWTWRGEFEPIGSRGQEVREIYLGSDIEKAKEIVNKYHINYIVVGQIETNKYADWLRREKIEQIAKPIFVSGGTTVFKTYSY